LDLIQALVYVKQVDVWTMKDGLVGLRYRPSPRAHARWKDEETHTLRVRVRRGEWPHVRGC
jgi:hypothetical protein